MTDNAAHLDNGYDLVLCDFRRAFRGSLAGLAFSRRALVNPQTNESDFVGC